MERSILLHNTLILKFLRTLEKMANYGIKEDAREEFVKVEVPSYLPRLFVSPSCLPKFAVTVESIAEVKAKLSTTILQLKESMRKKEQESVEKLYEECCWLRDEIDFEEREAKVMRKELVKRIYLEVRSVKEMMAVNDLMSGQGVGAAPGMECFRGTICVGGKLSKDVIKGIRIAQRLRKTF
ncbi:hypothetical protein LXL04_017368 [Taraxacum kok-saghyz]